MAKELNEDTSFKISVKTLVAIGAGLSALIGMWFTLQADIPEVTRMEFDMKDQLVRQTIMSTQEDVAEIKEDIKRIEEKIDKLR